MNQKLSPQKKIIVSALRDLKWHCGSEWLNRIKDDRKRCSELNEGYMREHGYTIVGIPCNGVYCGRVKCPLYARKAKKLESTNLAHKNAPSPVKREAEAYPTAEALEIARQSIEWFDNYQPDSALQRA